MKPSRIILITIDTLRADRLGCYGYGKDTSPNIDRLAREGLLFKSAFTPCTYTVPTHAAILTGRYPGNLSVFFNQFEGAVDTDREVFVQEVLADKGFETAAFVGAMVLARKWGLYPGFRVYDDEPTESEANRPDALYRRGEETNRRVFAWLGENHAKDFFLWIHYFDVHGPYVSPPPFDGFFAPEDYGPEPLPLGLVADGLPGGIPNYQALDAVKDAAGEVVSYESDARRYLAGYDSGVRHVDDVIGGLRQELERLGVYDDTALIVTSDHGESLGEDGVYYYHGLTVTPEQARVPLILKLPRGERRGETAADPVSTVDIMPTALALAGVENPVRVDGRSLLSAGERGRFITCENEWQRAAVHGERCLIEEKAVPRDGFRYYGDSKALCRGRRLFNYTTGETAGPEDDEAKELLGFAALLRSFSDSKEVSIRRKDIEMARLVSELAGRPGRPVDGRVAELEGQVQQLSSQLAVLRSQAKAPDGQRASGPVGWLRRVLKGKGKDE